MVKPQYHSWEADAPRPARAITLRVIDYILPNKPDGQLHYRLLTTLLDEKAAPLLELAELYHRRWATASINNELKTHLVQNRRVLRSRTPELVRQAFFGLVLMHSTVRWLLHQGAARGRIPHEDLSFVAHVQLLRQYQPQSGALPPRAAEEAQAVVRVVAGGECHLVGQPDVQPQPTTHGQATELVAHGGSVGRLAAGAD